MLLNVIPCLGIGICIICSITTYLQPYNITEQPEHYLPNHILYLVILYIVCIALTQQREWWTDSTERSFHPF
jgi:hypothetical protein